MNSFLNLASENQLLTILAILSFLLLVVVTSGVIYLTAIEWRDKRRRGDAARIPLGRGAGVASKGQPKQTKSKQSEPSKSKSSKSKSSQSKRSKADK